MTANEMKHPSKTQQETRRAAYHEAAHAVACLLFNLDLERVHILPDDVSSTLGGCSYYSRQTLDGGPLEPSWVRDAVIAQTGVIGEAIGRGAKVPFRRADFRAMGRQDSEALEAALDIGYSLQPKGIWRDREGYRAHVGKLVRDRAAAMLTSTGPSNAVHALATALLERRSLDGAEALRLVGPLVAPDLFAAKIG